MTTPTYQSDTSTAYCESRFGLAERRALVTGASQGIGHAIARDMVHAGADVALLAHDDLDTMRNIASSLRLTHGQTWGFHADLSRLEEIQTTYDRIVEECGGFDILVNCAGTTVRAPAETLRLEEWERVLRLNLSSVFAVSQAFARERIRERRPGTIINIASLMSEAARPSTAAYTASKGGIRQLTKALAVDSARYGITVNAIGPGYIRTPFTDALAADASFDAWVKERTPLGRWGVPTDISGVAVFLASSAARFLTGQILYVDGGWLSTF